MSEDKNRNSEADLNIDNEFAGKSDEEIAEIIKSAVEDKRDDIISTLSDFIKIESIAGEAEGDMPFGKNVHRAFSFMLDMAERDGFKTLNADNYGGNIRWDRKKTSERDETMGILCHIDVVPAGKFWDYKPFGGEIVDGKMYGRGTADDKGPTIASYFALKCLKDLGIKLSKNVEIILGLDEETKWSGMEYYLSKVDAPDFGFTPDADFPVVNGEKGVLTFSLAQKFGKTQSRGISLKSFKGGNASNMVADYARAVINSKNKEDYQWIREQVQSLASSEGFELQARGVGQSLEITAKGISAHGSTPEKGLNAISVIMQLLNKIPFDNDDVGDFIKFYNEHIGFDLNGERLGLIGVEDEVSGKTTVNVGVIDMTQDAVKLTVNTRYPVTKTDEDVHEAVADTIRGKAIGIIREKHMAPIYVPEDSPLIQTFMKVYKEATGDFEAKPKIIGGGTYSRAMKNFVAYGGIFPGEEELAHQKNEYIKIDSLIAMTKIYAEAIYRLCK